MSYLTVVFLGIVQGFTEFLPVSSSGHLVIAQTLMPDFSSPGILLEVVLHAGTLTAVVYYYKDVLLGLDHRYFKLLIVGTIPAALVGFLFKDHLELLFESIKYVGFALILTALFNYLTDKKQESEEKLDINKVLLIGTFQAFAIIPGISRSGSTIFASVYSGVDKKKAAEFSFILSVPAILGANFLEIITLESVADYNLGALLAGFVAAFISGLIAIKLTIKLLTNRSFKYFALYTVILGLLLML